MGLELQHSMARTLSTAPEGANGGSDPELRIRVTVPEEFAGFALGQINRHLGLITYVDFQHGCAMIQASLATSKFKSLSHEIVSFTIKGQVEHDR